MATNAVGTRDETRHTLASETGDIPAANESPIPPLWLSAAFPPTEARIALDPKEHDNAEEMPLVFDAFS